MCLIGQLTFEKKKETLKGGLITLNFFYYRKIFNIIIRAINWNVIEFRVNQRRSLNRGRESYKYILQAFVNQIPMNFNVTFVIKVITSWIN